MSEAITDSAASHDDMDDLLGTPARPRWRRWMKYWLPALVILLLVLGVAQCSRGGDGPNYITQEVVERSLNLTVTATGNLRPTNQVQVGSD